MPLRGEQRALLQLLCERGQSYGDISDLLGSEPDEVRENARAALQEIGGSDPDADVGLTDFLLGQADPIGRADAARYLQSNPDALELAKRIEAGLRLVAPEASLPKLPEPRGKRAKAAMPAAGEADSLDREARAVPITGEGQAGTRNRLIAVLALVGVILIVAILAIAGVFSKDNGDSGTSTGTDGVTTSADAPADDKSETVDLTATNGSGVGGSVTFSIVNGDTQSQPVADIDLKGLPAPTSKETALLWIMVGDNAGYPLSTPLVPDKNGSISGSVAVPGDIASIFSGQVTGIKISNSNIADVQDAVKAAIKDNALVLPFTGDELASGDLPAGG